MNARRLNRLLAPSIGITLLLMQTLLPSLLPVPTAQAGPFGQGRYILAPEAEIRYVAPGGDDGANPCTTSSTPCRTVQHALYVAAGGDEIYVAAGTYTGTMTAFLPAYGKYVTATAILTKSIASLSGGYSPDFADRDPDAYETVLSADGFPGALVVFISTTNTLLDGFTITGSDGALLWYWIGAGVRVNGGAPTISHNRIQDNSAPTWGSGIFVTNNAAPTISANLIYSNTAQQGAGIYILSGAAVITGNVIVSNTAETEGGGVFIDNAPVTIVSNTIAYNQVISPTVGRGGGVRKTGDSALVTLRHNEVYSNSLPGGGGSGLDITPPAILEGNSVHHNRVTTWGGAVVVSDASPPVTLTNNVIVQNTGAGILAVNFGDVRVVNNTVAWNLGTASLDATGINIDAWPITPTYPFTATIINNIVANNANSGIAAQHGATLMIDYNDIVGNSPNYYGLASPGLHDISADPQFINTTAGDYHLHFGSPAMNAGTNASAPPDDREGTPRPQMGRVDLGAYELYGYQIFLPLTSKN